MRNSRTRSHARKQASLTRIGDPPAGPLDKGLVDVMVGCCRSDGIDAGNWCRHYRLSFCREGVCADVNHGAVNNILKV